MLESIQLDTSDVFPNLVPAIRSKAEVLERAESAREKDRGGIPAIDFVGDTQIVLLVDHPDALVWVDQPIFEAMNLGGSALDLAIQNLRKRTKAPLEFIDLHPDIPSAARLAGDDALATGRLLLHDLWEPLRERMNGELLVRVASRRNVLACTNGVGDIAFVEHVAKKLGQDEGIVTNEFFIWMPDSWGLVELPGDESDEPEIQA